MGSKQFFFPGKGEEMEERRRRRQARLAERRRRERRQRKRSWRDSSIRFLSTAPKGNKEDKRQIHGDDLFCLFSGCATEEEQFLAHHIGGLSAGRT